MCQCIFCSALAEGNAYTTVGQLIGSETPVVDAAISGDTLYLLDGADSLYAWDGQAETASLLLESAEAGLLIGGDELLLCTRDGSQIGRLAGQSVEWLGGVTPEALAVDASWIRQAFCLEGSLYLLYGSETDPHLPGRIARCDAQGVTVFPVMNAREMAPFGDGRLLVLEQDPYSADNSIRFAAVSAMAGEALSELPTLPDGTAHAGGLAYDRAQGYALVCDSGRVLRYGEAAGWETVNYVPQMLMESLAFAGCLNGRYLYLDSGSLVMRDTLLARAEQASPLVVRGYGFDPYMIPTFMSDHPEIPLVIDNDFSVSRTQFISAIQSGDSSADIYVLPDSWNVWSLIDKGYAKDLSAYPALRESIGSMIPQLQQAVSRGEQIFALPIALYVSAWAVRPDLLEAAGYDHIPETMAEFLEMQHEWDWDKEGEYDFTFASTAYDGYALRFYPYLEMAVSEYITQYERSDQSLSFDTSAFRQVLATLESLGNPSENVDEVLAAPADESMLSARPAAIFTLGDSNPLNVGETGAYNKVLMPAPPFEENGERRTLATIFLAIVNPYSQHVEEAATFLTYAARRSATDATLTLYSDQNDPVPNQGVLVQLEEARQELERKRTLLNSADDAHRAEAEVAVTQQEAAIAELEAWQYLVSAEAIEAYRALEPYLYIPQDSPYWRATTEMKVEIEGLLKQYAAGALDGEGLIRQLDQRFQLLFWEQ